MQANRAVPGKSWIQSRVLSAAIVCALIVYATVLQAASPLQFAWQDDTGAYLYTLDQQRLLTQQPLPAALTTPLGSVWKLLVYAYQLENDLPDIPYQCRGQDQQEIYCCTPGQTIVRDSALVRSCGLYFAPDRLGISAEEWQQFWQSRQAPAWLQQLDALQPATRVPVQALLRVLETLPARQTAQNLLLDVITQADGPLAGIFGSRLRVKTWSWQEEKGERQGGFAGWMSDGTPLWAQGSGTSKSVLNQYAEVLGRLLPELTPVRSQECVQVVLFSRYPLTAVQRLADGQPVDVGPLQGHFKVLFAKGNQLNVQSQGELFLQREGNELQLIARLDREEYVARVLQREAQTQPIEAAKAMTVAIRTYLQQQAQRGESCLLIDDSSATQRVAPSPANQEALSIAAWTQDLVLAGTSVNYHYDRTAPALLSWQSAVTQAKQGARYDAILAQAFPRGNLSRWENPVASCSPLPQAEAWLRKQLHSWRTTLQQEAGYQGTSHFAVCRLSYGQPFVDRKQRRIYIRDFYSLQDRLDLTHEYLHLAFDGHPNTLDEVYIESLTRDLLLE